ncbi:hypothetical protein BASA81_017669 [Batrachochytrium salamandrivorans]|nr:hypothetical protein BASA81_017669 [Batrachochytrium salamandrivorans]
MRVGTGIIISVLSSSVLAAVIPDYDSHDTPLVRRAGSLENKDVSWSKDNEDEVKFIPSSSGAGDGAGSGGNRGSGKMGRFRDYIEGLFKNLKTTLSSRQRKSIEEKDEQSVKNTIKKVAGVVQGESTKNFLFEVENFLRTTLGVSRPAYMLYGTSDIIPVFSLTIPNSSAQKSLTKEMLKIKNAGKQHTKTHLGDVVSAIGDLTKRPQNVIKELGRILESILTMCRLFELLYSQEYKALLSKVGRANNGKHIKDTKKYISQLRNYRTDVSESFRFIKTVLESGKVTFKGNNPSKFDNFKLGVKRRLGIKSTPSTGVPPNPESSNLEPSNQDTPDQEPVKSTFKPRWLEISKSNTSV